MPKKINFSIYLCIDYFVLVKLVSKHKMFPQKTDSRCTLCFLNVKNDASKDWNCTLSQGYQSYSEPNCTLIPCVVYPTD